MMKNVLVSCVFALVLGVGLVARVACDVWRTAAARQQAVDAATEVADQIVHGARPSGAATGRVAATEGAAAKEPEDPRSLAIRFWQEFEMIRVMSEPQAKKLDVTDFDAVADFMEKIAGQMEALAAKSGCPQELQKHFELAGTLMRRQAAYTREHGLDCTEFLNELESRNRKIRARFGKT